MNMNVSVGSMVLQWRARAYYKVMSFGRSPLRRLQLRAQIAIADLFQVIALIGLGFLEFLYDPFPLEVKKRAQKGGESKKAA